MKNVGFRRVASILTIFCIVTVASSSAQTLTTLLSFDGTNGAGIYEGSSLIQGTDGNFYGASLTGGAFYSSSNLGYGTIFKVTPAGRLTTLYNFCSQSKCADGEYPNGTLVQGTDGNFYGTTQLGGSGLRSDCPDGCGTVFKVTPAGKLTTLYSFCTQANCTDGISTFAGLVQGANGNLYGTTWEGGVTCGACGTVFEITPTGKFTTLHSFDSTHGSTPMSTLMQATNGVIYGTTQQGGAFGDGTVFAITPAGKFMPLHNFGPSPVFAAPNTLIQGSDGNLYGTTFDDGLYQFGTVFELTLGGQFTTLYSFCPHPGCYDGAYPKAGLVQGTDGNFYGVAGGGLPLYGVIFQITPAGNFTTLYSFCEQAGCPDGDQPAAAMVQGTDGNFYGTTSGDGVIREFGTIFRWSMGLGPFVEARPNFGQTGRVIGILGNNLTGATSVTFNDAPATFTVVSSTLIKATVPSGATTGTIEVTTPSRTLSSDVAFQVRP
jgi:uncharacterized repeat protein (TIGR03803 family)